MDWLSSSEGINIFDLYLDRNIKEGERKRRNQDGLVETKILQLKKSLPVGMENFWGSWNNKMQLEQIFIEWIIKSYKGSGPLFLGDGNKDDITSCVMIANGEVSFQPLLICDHEEADNRLLLRANHALKINNYKKFINASPDTDALVNVIHHFSCWMFTEYIGKWGVRLKTKKRKTRNFII